MRAQIVHFGAVARGKFNGSDHRFDRARLAPVAGVAADITGAATAPATILIFQENRRREVMLALR
jgi:hypothetical protein